MGHRHHSHRSSSSSSDSSFAGNVPGVWLPLGKSQTNKEKKTRKKSPETVVNNNFLMPKARKERANSVGAQPAAQVVVIDRPVERSVSRSRSRSRHHHRRRSSSSSSSESRSRSRGRDVHRGRQLTYEQWQKIQEADAARISQKERDARDRAEERYKEKQKLDKAEWELKQQAAARKAADEKKELEAMKKLWEADKEAAEAKEKLRQKQWEAEKAEAEAKEKARRDQIVMEAKLAEEKKKKDAEELRKRILAEEEEKQKKEKEKKKKEDEEFEQKVKEKFMAAGYTPKQIEDILHRKKEDAAIKRNELAIATSRPTFIKVHRKYLHPDTLEAYNLPWHYDPKNTEYIIIKQYIDNDFQEILFEHTRTLYKRKLITDGYTTETTVTLRPANVYKEKDKMYIVREKSKSPGRERSRSRRGSWMFT